jgi:hypothetical protein
MPSKASCVECMMDGPVAPARPADTQLLEATHWIAARFDGRCARRMSHEIEVGDRIGYVDEVGWCCEECAT